MSLARVFSHSYTGVRLAGGAAGQLLLAAAAVAGVMCVSGCANQQQQQQWAQVHQLEQQQMAQQQQYVLQQQQQHQQQPAMPSALASQARATLIEQPIQPQLPPRPSPRTPIDPVASSREKKAARQTEIANAMNEAMTPPQPLANVSRGTAALRVTEKAIGPLADTLNSIESAQRVVIENLRNTEVPGYKASRSACGDGRDISKQLDIAQGELQPTQRSLDVAIQGDGFFQIQVYVEGKPDSVVGFTRNGRLFVSKDGNLVIGQESGYKVVPPIQVPVGTTELRIEQDGTVRAAQAGAEKPGLQPLGRLSVARFTDPSALQPLGTGIYAETEASGTAVETPAGERGAGTIVQGYLEASNVDLVREQLRMRFLQTWRSTILATMDGELPTRPAPTQNPAVNPAPAPTAPPSVRVDPPTGRPMIRSVAPAGE